MADAREQAGWIRTFVLVRQVAATGFQPRRVSPADVIPDRYLPDDLRPDPKDVANRERIENDLAWAALGEGLRAGVRG